MAWKHDLRIAGLLLALSVFSSARADEPPAAEPPSQSGETADLEPLIRDLDANRFSQRQTASQKLIQLGKDAFPALEKVAQGESREASRRALDILRKQLESGDNDTRAAAKAALERLAAGDHAAAGQAKEILEPKSAPPANPPQLGGLRIQQGQFQIQVQAIGGQQIQVQNVNGVTEIKAREDGRTVKIVNDPNNGIKVEITEKKDGKEVTNKVEAKDAAELKKQHPEAYRWFEKYSKQGAPIQIQAFPLMPGMPNLPLQNLQPAQSDNARAAMEELRKATKELDETKNELEKLSQQDAHDPAALRAATERLTKIRQAIEAAKDKLEN